MNTGLYVTAIVVVLNGCCSDVTELHAQSPNPPVSWEGLGRRAIGHTQEAAKAQKTIRKKAVVADGTADKEAELATLKVYSSEWWSVHDAIDRANDAKLAKTLIICSNCLPPVAEDRTGSIAGQ
jgi:hypothetical protein